MKIMIISCPNCHAGFVVSKEQIGESGRRVKCSKCKNIWYATHSESDISESIIPSKIDYSEHKHGTNLPAIIPTRISKFLFVLPILLVALISSTIWFFYPEMTSAAGVCGPVCAGSGIKISDVVIDYNKQEQLLNLSYAITNVSGKTKQMPLVEIKLIASNGQVISKIYTENLYLDLESDSSIRATASFSNIKNQPSSVEIAVGSKIKFWLM